MNPNNGRVEWTVEGSNSDACWYELIGRELQPNSELIGPEKVLQFYIFLRQVIIYKVSSHICTV